MLLSLRELYTEYELNTLTQMEYEKVLDLYEYSKEEVVEIRYLENMLNDVVFISTPDGYQKVNYLVKKGFHKGAIVKVKDKTIVTTYDHLFDLERGWTYAENVVEGDKVLFEDGNYYPISVCLTDDEYNIYDMEVDHENHRYYADGISSHNTGVGKTTALVNFSCNMVRNGEDVLYITLEMSEEKISQRHEANFIDTPINEIRNVKDDDFKTSLLSVKKQQVGRLIIKEYPPASISSENVRALLDELELKKNFKPTVLVVDYLNLLRSSRLMGDNLYVTIKAISEELRGIAVEKDLCCITATQANRQGNDSKNTDLDFTNVGESKAISDTCDFLAALISPEELREQNLQIWKVLKNRFGGTVNYRFPIRTEHDKARLSDADDMQLVSNEMSDDAKNHKKRKKKEPMNVVISDEPTDVDLFD